MSKLILILSAIALGGYLYEIARALWRRPPPLCFLCSQPIHGKSWAFAEGLAHPECALARTTTRGKR